MLRRLLFAVCCVGGLAACSSECQAQQAFGRQWGHSHNTQDWQRFYHYPYTYYPQNFWSKEYFKSSESLYYRYPAEMRIPMYNRAWHNEYPEERRYHSGHHFILDTF